MYGSTVCLVPEASSCKSVSCQLPARPGYMACWVERLCVKRFWLLPSTLTQYGASVSLSILFRSIQDLNSVERKEGDVMALLSMFGESLHLCTVQTERAKHFGPSSTTSVISIKCTYISYVSTHFPACVQNHSRFRKVHIGHWYLDFRIPCGGLF